MTTLNNTYPKHQFLIAVGVIKNDCIYLSRRLSKDKMFKGKWQFVNGPIKEGETVLQTAARIVSEHIGTEVDNRRLSYIEHVTDEEAKIFYYLYLFHLRDGEDMINPVDESENSPWKLYKINKSLVLDLVPRFRPILRKLYLSHIKVTRKEFISQ